MKLNIKRGFTSEILAGNNHNGVVGLRFDSVKRIRKLGEDLPRSRNLMQGALTKYVDGTSAISLEPSYNVSEEEALEEINEKFAEYGKGYIENSNHIYIVAGTSEHYGDDDGEVVIKNAYVVAVLGVEK